MSGKALLFAGAGVLSLVAFGGCVEHHRYHEEPVATVTVEPVPEGYVYYSDPYYYRGHYEGDAWYWRDRDGHDHREVRDEHDRRMREHPHYEGERDHH